MANLKRLNEAIRSSDYSVGVIAKKAGMTRQSLYNKRLGKREFSVGEMAALCKVLNLSKTDRDQIFFG